jgi:hypothetical protein
MTTLQCLVKAKKVINTPDKWCKGIAESDCNGNDPRISKKKTVKWDIDGAIYKIAKNDLWLAENVFNVIENIIEKKTGRNAYYASDYNDAPRRTHAQIMRLFDEAIKYAKKNNL